MGTQTLDIDRADVQKAINSDTGGSNSSNTVNGDWIDTQETLGVRFIVAAAVANNGSLDLHVESADEPGQSDAADVPDKYLTRAEADISLDAVDEVVAIGYTGPERYVRIVADENSWDGQIYGIAETLPETGQPADTTTA
jgi:NAD(P)-dependent dehydrogenase (short-subunit alcohol dehydrogenase family)